MRTECNRRSVGLVVVAVAVATAGPAAGVPPMVGSDAESTGPRTLQPIAEHGETPIRTDEPSANRTVTRVLKFPQGTATVFLNCSVFRMEMTPTALDYYLGLVYLDTTTGERYRFLAGPLNGRVVDPFGDTTFLLLEVEVRVPGDPSVAVHLPRRCLDATTNSPHR